MEHLPISNQMWLGGVNMTLREELLKIQEEVRAKYAKQKEAEAA